MEWDEEDTITHRESNPKFGRVDEERAGDITSQFPTWLFPDTGKSQTTGTLNGAYFVDTEAAGLQVNFQLNDGWCPTLKVSRTGEVTPPSRVWEKPIPRGRIEREVERMVRYHEANAYDAFIPRDLMRNLVMESLKTEREEYVHDPFGGNSLDVYTPCSDHAILAYPGGDVLNELRFGQLNGGRSDDVVTPVDRAKLAFANPILQLTSSKTAPALSTSRLLAVRDHGSVAIVATCPASEISVNETANAGLADWPPHDGFPIPHLIDIVSFNQRPLHMTFSPVIANEAAILLDGGELYLWDGYQPTSSRSTLLATYDDNASSYPLRWKSCEFGAHPRTLMVAHANRLETIDFRSRGIMPTPIFKVDSKERIWAFNREHEELFQSVLCTSKRTVLLDIRFPRRPLLQWKFQNNRDPPVGIEFLSADRRYPQHQWTFVTWTRLRGEIMAYNHKSLHTSQIIKSSFYEHCSPSITLPPSSCAGPTLLNRFRRHGYESSQDRYSKVSYGTWGHQQALIENEEIPGWPPLRGLTLFTPDQSSQIDVLKIGDDGRVSFERYGHASTTSQAESGSPPFQLNLEENSIPDTDSAICQSDVTDLTQLEVRRQDFPGLYKDHERVNWTLLTKSIEMLLLSKATVDVDIGRLCANKEPSQWAMRSWKDKTRQATLWELVTTEGEAITYGEDGKPIMPELYSFDRLKPEGSSTPALGNDEPAMSRISYAELLFTQGAGDHDTLRKQMEQLFPIDMREENNTSTASTAVADGTEIARELLVRDAYLASRLILNPHRKPGATDHNMEGVDEPDIVNSELSDTDDKPWSSDHVRAGVLYTPYSDHPARLSPAAMELRKRWTNPDKYYGLESTVDYSQEAGVKRRDKAGALERLAERRHGRSLGAGETSVPSVFSSSQMSSHSGVTDDADWWASSVPSQSWSQPQVHTGWSLLSQGATGLAPSSQPVGQIFGSSPASARKKKPRRKGF
ncbi:hypothetical protein SpCBS45565_g04356 [Spizellomyces sp. 'palustris']|nr:hypothetical protein SpCBS45565_g04356 [Spizellomyces sp. 'palustris']